MANRVRALIVEDDPATVEILISILGSQYQVSSANTVAEALAFLRTSHVGTKYLGVPEYWIG